MSIALVSPSWARSSFWGLTAFCDLRPEDLAVAAAVGGSGIEWAMAMSGALSFSRNAAVVLIRRPRRCLQLASARIPLHIAAAVEVQPGGTEERRVNVRVCSHDSPAATVAHSPGPAPCHHLIGALARQPAVADPRRDRPANALVEGDRFVHGAFLDERPLPPARSPRS